MTDPVRLPFFRKKPARHYKRRSDMAGNILNQISPYDIRDVYRLHQSSPDALVVHVAHKTLPIEALCEADGFVQSLTKKTGWKCNLTFLEVAKNLNAPRADTSEDQERGRTIDLGFCWRMFLVSKYPDIWTSPPTLTDYKNDVEWVQQAALYCPEAAQSVVTRMSEKYDRGLWIIGEHFTSWEALKPYWQLTWGQFFKSNEYADLDSEGPTYADKLSNTDFLRRLDWYCEHILYEINAHIAKQGNRGRTGSALLAKVVDECWMQWRFAKLPSPDGDSEFPIFYKFVMRCIEVIAPPGFKENRGTKDTVKKYLDLFILDNNGLGRMNWSKEEFSNWAPPGARLSEQVSGHTVSCYPPTRKYWWPRTKIRAIALFNILRGYPPTLNNHNHFM